MEQQNRDEQIKMDETKLNEQRKASRKRYLESMDQLASIKDEISKTVEQTKPMRNTAWAERVNQAERLSKLNAMVSLIGQGVMASSGVRPGAAPQVVDSEALIKQMNKINDDYRYDSNQYTQNKLKESLAQAQIYADLAEKELDLDKSQQSGELRKEMSQERSLAMESIAKQNNQSRESIAEKNRQKSLELEQIKQQGASNRLAQSNSYKIDAEQRKSERVEPVMYLQDTNNQRVGISEGELVGLYEIAKQNRLLKPYYDAKNENIRNSELRLALKQAMDKRNNDLLEQSTKEMMISKPIEK